MSCVWKVLINLLKCCGVCSSDVDGIELIFVEFLERDLIDLGRCFLSMRVGWQFRRIIGLIFGCLGALRLGWCGDCSI